jgi:hypothetical protein
LKQVRLKDFSKELGNFCHASLKEQRKAVISGIARSLPMLAETSPVDTGLYAASWGMNIEEEAVLLGNYAPYAGIIEDGARPFTPPIRPLLAWAKRVLGDPSQPPSYSKPVWALAKHTQMKIAEFGMSPKHVMANAIPEIIKNIRLELERAR